MNFFLEILVLSHVANLSLFLWSDLSDLFLKPYFWLCCHLKLNLKLNYYSEPLNIYVFLSTHPQNTNCPLRRNFFFFLKLYPFSRCLLPAPVYWVFFLIIWDLAVFVSLPFSQTLSIELSLNPEWMLSLSIWDWGNI